jgi:ATP-dependent RNA helicase SUPV3L1/SUV3
MESFYTFVWAPRPRGGENRGPRRERPEARGRGPRAATPAFNRHRFLADEAEARQHQ